jgi:N6-adenosine-specific RNA methylase IME4
MKDLAIQQIDKVRAMLERATTLPELREIVSVADAARVYAKRALCTLEVVNHAQRILDAWGFEYKGTFVWVKPQIGMGNYWWNSHETMLLGVRGGLRGQSGSERSWMERERGLHSEKPEEVRERIERLSPGPYLELFGRRPVDGWTVYGNQLLK